MLELLLELLEAITALLDQRRLVPHHDQAAREVRADLSSACDQEVHQTTSVERGGSSQLRTASVTTSIAVDVGHTVRRPLDS